jgi:hypothetical protein
MDASCLVRGKAFVVLEESNNNPKSISAWSPQFPTIFGEGATCRLALKSLRNGIYTDIEWQLSKNPGLKQINILPLSQGKQRAVLEKWRLDTEGESIISHTVLDFAEGV